MDTEAPIMPVYRYSLTYGGGEASGTIEAKSKSEAKRLLTNQYKGVENAQGKPVKVSLNVEEIV
jgi:hypothetical protein